MLTGIGSLAAACDAVGYLLTAARSASDQPHLQISPVLGCCISFVVVEAALNHSSVYSKHMPD